MLSLGISAAQIAKKYGISVAEVRGMIIEHQWFSTLRILPLQKIFIDGSLHIGKITTKLITDTDTSHFYWGMIT